MSNVTLEQAMKLLDRHHSLRNATEPRYILTFLGKDTDEILKAYDEQPKQSSTYECPYCKLDILYGEYHDCKFGRCPPRFQDEQQERSERPKPEAEQPTTFGATQCFKCFCDVKECTCGVIHKPKGDDCSMESIVYFGTKLSKKDQERIEGFLAHKHNMQGNLPDSHPYKDAPPSVTQPEATAASEPGQRHACLDHGCQNCAHRKTLYHEPPCNSCAHNPYATNDPCRYEQPKQDQKRIEPLRYNVSSVTDSKPLRFMLGSIQDTINELIERLNGGQE